MAQSVAACANRFDPAAALSPEASAAHHCFGDPGRLARASEEIAQCACDWGFLRPEGTHLDIGCGIGRMEWALAQRVAFIIGVDISPRMLDLARQRCAGLGNVAFQLASGDLAAFEDTSVDGVLAIDCFPYLMECGPALAYQLLGESQRVLEPGGQLLIWNFSYRSALNVDRADEARWAERAGMTLLRNGVRELQSWDGAAFQLRACA